MIAAARGHGKIALQAWDLKTLVVDANSNLTSLSGSGLPMGSVLCVFMLRAQAEAEKPNTISWHLSESESSTKRRFYRHTAVSQYPRALWALQELAASWRRCSRLLWASWRKAAWTHAPTANASSGRWGSHLHPLPVVPHCSVCCLSCI